MIKFILLMLLTLSFAIPVNAGTAKIYVWRNENGELVYSDTPKPGAEEVITKPGNIIKSSTTLETQVLDIHTKEIIEEYQVAINYPEQNATIRDNTGAVFVSGIITPIFKRGLKIQLILDGKPYQKPQNDARFSLRNVDRGEHQIKMKIFNEQGKVIALSTPVTFYMHRSSVN
ncbi:DUF4124 domain-containing protein [Colwellia sp. MSW7]|uniref:DUF4124 domain-containing protein n=1 Tax=Colwellia maritima TaxID=2912588 RepID=A0ABS9WY51_9GAMM|nr:DUF4124 domain-containing protein [Colwellia maritima]MCI2282893.1 DUF4124 domain-containing protein [Colwellia maritima]